MIISMCINISCISDTKMKNTHLKKLSSNCATINCRNKLKASFQLSKKKSFSSSYSYNFDPDKEIRFKLCDNKLSQ